MLLGWPCLGFCPWPATGCHGVHQKLLGGGGRGVLGYSAAAHVSWTLHRLEEAPAEEVWGPSALTQEHPGATHGLGTREPALLPLLPPGVSLSWP